MVEVGPGHRQTVAVDTAQAVVTRIATHERPHVGFKEALGDTLGLEELTKVADGDIASAVGIERITLANGLAVEAVQLALVTLI
ncbi:hypothetical protein D3C77_644060 [compost metagenome]